MRPPSGVYPVKTGDGVRGENKTRGVFAYLNKGYARDLAVTALRRLSSHIKDFRAATTRPDERRDLLRLYTPYSNNVDARGLKA